MAKHVCWTFWTQLAKRNTRPCETNICAPVKDFCWCLPSTVPRVSKILVSSEHTQTTQQAPQYIFVLFVSIYTRLTDAHFLFFFSLFLINCRNLSRANQTSQRRRRGANGVGRQQVRSAGVGRRHESSKRCKQLSLSAFIYVIYYLSELARRRPYRETHNTRCMCVCVLVCLLS